ncbi:MAG TPA: glycosyltransferase family 4 protein [Nitrososphaeraceae archaeon]|nr:glycosyltransferase family 4 protein [Nitrososphaeraceae archaeon]
MRILFLTAHIPFPPASGGRRREFELISRLGNDFELHLCSLTESPDIDNKYAEKLRSYCESISIFKTESLPTTNDTFRYPLLMKRYYSKEGINGISQLIKSSEFDIIHVEGSYLMQLIPEDCPLPVLLVEHNVEYSICSQRLRLSISESDKSFHLQERNNTLLWEHSFWRRAKKIITLTLEDEKLIIELEPNVDVAFIPNGIDHYLTIDRTRVQQQYNNRVRSNSVPNIRTVENCPSILFVANFAYDPNVDAAVYFCKQILPLILKNVPDAKFFVVGNSPSTEIFDLASSSSRIYVNTSALANPNVQTINTHIEVTGYVDSLDPFYKFAKVVVCPLRIGGGIKVKILEALRAGKAIVTTPIGAQGFGLNNEALCVCNQASDFANNVVRFLINPVECHRQEERALRFANMLPTWDQVKEQYVSCYEELASKQLTTDIKLEDLKKSPLAYS